MGLCVKGSLCKGFWSPRKFPLHNQDPRGSAKNHFFGQVFCVQGYANEGSWLWRGSMFKYLKWQVPHFVEVLGFVKIICTDYIDFTGSSFWREKWWNRSIPLQNRLCGFWGFQGSFTATFSKMGFVFLRCWLIRSSHSAHMYAYARFFILERLQVVIITKVHREKGGWVPWFWRGNTCMYFW